MKKFQKIALVLLLVCLAITSIGIFTIIKDNQYAREFTLNDSLPDGEGKRATVILLGGQSNAAGRSIDDYLQKNVSEAKYAEYENGYSNVYINYFSSGDNSSNEFVKCSVRQGDAGGFFGPELGLAEKLNEEYPDETFFIIKYAWSGTSIYDQWLSPSSIGRTCPLYKEFVRFVEMSMNYLISKNYEVKIAGMCWMQGESDASTPIDAILYEHRLINFIEDLRNEFADYSPEGGFAFVDAYIADAPELWTFCDLVNRSKQAVADSHSLNVVIDTVKEGLKCDAEPIEEPDRMHYDALSELKLGHLFAQSLESFLD